MARRSCVDRRRPGRHELARRLLLPVLLVAARPRSSICERDGPPAWKA